MWTNDEIADMEADDGRERLMPLWVRRGVAKSMRDQNAAEARWAANATDGIHPTRGRGRTETVLWRVQGSERDTGATEDALGPQNGDTEVDL